MRRLGESEEDAVQLNLGLNYHLDSYLDEDSKRFAEEFPQVFQVRPERRVLLQGMGFIHE